MITGKDVYEAGRAHLEQQGFEGIAWEDFAPGAQDFYLEIAKKLNAQFIAPLITDLGKPKEEKKTATNYRNDQLTLSVSEEGESSYSVTWSGIWACSQMSLFCASADGARKLFEALQTVIGIEEG